VQIKVFIVDDHYMVIEGIRSLLQHERTVELIGHAMSAESCIAFLKLHQPDVILMDINLPDKTGIELCREVKEKYPSIFILGLSTFNQQSFVQRMIDHGASGYVLKNASGDELLDAIRTVSKGKTFMSFEVEQILKNKPDSEIVITRRELEVLAHIAEGMTNNEIAQKLFISITTVDTHRKNLLEKFSAKNTAELVKLAFQHKFLND
jgi:DNA-binding NarL/FixJ family response regulator